MHKKLLLTILSLILFAGSPAYSGEARITDLIVTNTRDDLLIYLNLKDAFREKVEKAILSGLKADFSFNILLKKTRNFWPDKKLAEINVVHTIKYNNLKKEFTVTHSRDEDKPVVAKSFMEARKLMSEIDSLKIIPLNKLEKGVHYQIRAKAKISQKTLPFYLHYILFFVSSWDFETDWYTIDFIY